MSKRENAELLAALAAKGYFIASSDSPNPSQTSDLRNKAKDMEFLMDHLQLSNQEVIFMGYSLGSLAAIISGAERGARAVVAMAPPAHELPREGIEVPAPYEIPMAFIVGAADSVAPVQFSVPFLEKLRGSVDFLKIENGTHLGFVDIGGAFPAAMDRMLCVRFISHFPAGYRCPPVYATPLSTREQKKIVRERVEKFLNNLP